MIDVLIRDLHDAFGMGIWVIDRDEHYRTVKVLRPVEFVWEEHEQGRVLPRPTFENRRG